MSPPIQTVLQIGSNGLVIDTECQLSNGLPSIVIVGLGNKAVEEAKERVRSAFASSQLALPRKRITINLAPADVPKESTSLDLAIALSILQADGQIKHQPPGKTAFIGELGLDGTLRAVRGIIGKILIGQHYGMEQFVIPQANISQAQLVPGIRVLPIKNLKELLLTFTAENTPPISLYTDGGIVLPASPRSFGQGLGDIAGQHHAKRGLEIAAGGGHNIFFSGPPGTGKSMLARALPSLLPPLSRQEVLEVTQLHSLVNGNYDELITERPFRAPHHSASHVAIVGGGHNLRPGEISLAHRGVLFLDELPEFTRSTIEALRQPLEDRAITVVRAKDSTSYPANFILIATANPCPCGYFGTTKACICPAHTIRRYRQKLSGPIMDRIDLYAEVQQVEHARLLTAKDEDMTLLYGRIKKARQQQMSRFQDATKLNAHMTNRDIKTTSQLSSEAKTVLNEAAEAMDLSARSYMRVIKVARTIADLGECKAIQIEHITEALQYRSQNLQTLL
jgi:magnesium chelatase family protein